MSYQIIKHRFVLTFIEPEPAPGCRSPRRWNLFTEFSACNNVDPRTYSGEVICAESDFSDSPREWNGNILLPSKLWAEGHLADGGSIKAYPGRDVSGTGWISGWKKIAAKPIPVADDSGRLFFPFDLSVWMNPDQCARYASGEIPAFRYKSEGLSAAWESLILPELKASSGHRQNFRIHVGTTAALSSAACLLHQPLANSGDSIGIYLCLSESTGDFLARQFESMPDPQEKPKPSAGFAAGRIIELYGHRYTLTGKNKSSWVGTKDGRTYRIGPKHFANAKLVA